MSPSSSRDVCLVSTVVMLSIAFGFIPWSPAERGVAPLPAMHGALSNNTTAYIVYTYPVDGQVDVPLDAPIVVAFSEPIEPARVAWTITPGITAVVMWDLSFTLLTLAHAPFMACTRYTAEILGVAPGPVPNPWSFTTASCPPRIGSTSPPDGATNVSLNASLVVSFSEPMDPASVTLTIDPAIALVPSWDPTITVLTLAHGTPFAAGTVYTVQVDGKDTAGRPLLPGAYTWSFRTVCLAPYPLTAANLPPGGPGNARLVVATQP